MKQAKSVYLNLDETTAAVNAAFPDELQFTRDQIRSLVKALAMNREAYTRLQQRINRYACVWSEGDLSTDSQGNRINPPKELRDDE